MHDSRNRFLLLLVAILALVLAPVALAQDQGTPAGQQQPGQDMTQDQDQDQDQLQQRARDQIQLEDQDVEIAHNDAIDEDGVTHDDRLVVDTIFSNGPGWLVVYAMPDGQAQNQAQGQGGFQTAAQCAAGTTSGQAQVDADADADVQANADANADAAAAGQANREQALGQMGIVGYAPLQNGVNRGIEVPVDATRATQVLCLQVHRDAGEIGAFEFPGADAPATGGLLINVIGGLLDEQGQLLAPGAQRDQAQAQDMDADADLELNGDADPAPDQDQDQQQQRARDQIQLEDPNVEIAHNDVITGDGGLTHDDRVVVETVFSSGPGWLVVYAASGGSQAGANNQAQGQGGFQTAAQCVAVAGAQDLNAAEQSLDADTDDQALDADADGEDLDTDADGEDLDADADAQADADADANAAAAGQANREQALGQMGIVGYAPLQNGVNRGIEVPVDATRATQVLCLQVHRDAGEIGAFEFPGADAPATGGLLINVIGGLLDERGQLIVQDQDQDQDTAGDQDADQDEQDQDQDEDEDTDGDGGLLGPGPLFPPVSGHGVVTPTPRP